MAVAADKQTVIRVQQALKAKGYDPGPIDGIVGPKTNAAMVTFQMSHGITGNDAVAWARTLAKLFDGSTPENQLVPDRAPDWINWISNYDNTRALFLKNWHALKDIRPWVATRHPEMLAQHDAIMKRFTDQVPTIDKLAQLRAQVAGWVESIGGTVRTALNMTGVQAGLDWLKGTSGLNGLSAIPLVYVAIGLGAAVASIHTIAGMVHDAGLYSQRLEALKAFEEKGYSPEQAASAVNSVLGAPGTSISGRSGDFLGLPVNQLLIGAIALVLGPPIINMLAGRR